MNFTAAVLDMPSGAMIVWALALVGLASRLLPHSENAA